MPFGLADKTCTSREERPDVSAHAGGLPRLLAHQVTLTRATVIHLPAEPTPDQIGLAIADTLADADVHDVLVSTTLPAAWQRAIDGDGVRVLREQTCSSTEHMDAAGALVAPVALAVAGSGRLYLDRTGGRRPLSVSPRLHIYVVGEEALVQTDADAAPRLAAAAAAGRPLSRVRAPAPVVRVPAEGRAPEDDGGAADAQAAPEASDDVRPASLTLIIA